MIVCFSFGSTLKHWVSRSECSVRRRFRLIKFQKFIDRGKFHILSTKYSVTAVVSSMKKIDFQLTGVRHESY